MQRGTNSNTGLSRMQEPTTTRRVGVASLLTNLGATS